MHKRKYILAMYLCLSVHLLSCSNEKSTGLPEIETDHVAEITQITAVSGGRNISEGGSQVTAKGVCWGTNVNPTLSGYHTVDGSGNDDYSSVLSPLTPDTDYHVRAYATNADGTAYGNDRTLKTLPSAQTSQIIADHTVVDRFDDIPQYYIDQVKKMWLSVPGESHTEAYRTGLLLLESLNLAYAVNIVSSGTPEAFTTSHLRASRATWGDLTNTTGWIYDYGEEDWFSSATAISRTKAGIAYCNTHNLRIAAIGYGWCYDPNVNYTNISSYINATKEYIDFCATSGYSTKVFFTTGPVDGDSYTNNGNGGAYGYNIWLRMEAIRDYVALDETRILFDYADILSHDDNGTFWTLTYEGNTYEVISPTNLGDGRTGHIGSAGSIRLAKAIWWMLARMAGWDGT